MNLKQIDDLAMQAAIYIEELQKHVAELEAENAELKRAHASQLKANVDLYRAIGDANPTREQIAALVKPLEWSKSLGIWTAYGANFDYSYGDDKPRLFTRDLRDNRTPNTLYPDFAELRAAAEAHHRETVISLLNIPA